MLTKFKFTLCNEEGEEVEYEVPGKMEVCPRCGGHGTHLNPSIGQHAYSQEEFEQEFDEEEREAYFTRGGMYDVSCEQCHGRCVVCVPDHDRCNAEQKVLLEKWDELEADREADERADERIRRMENGGYDY